MSMETPPNALRNAGPHRPSLLAVLLFALIVITVPAIAEPLTLEITEAEVGYDTRNNSAVVSFRMSEDSRKAFAEFSTRHVGEKIDIRVDGNSVLQTVIREPITGGVGQINASSPDQARRLVERLTSKAPLTVDVVP
jgi:preprotein translocase subunit SecD